MTKNICNSSDLRNWCDSALGAQATEVDIDSLWTAIQADPKRPLFDQYGEWTDYLDSLDVWELVYNYANGGRS